jgi:hypothetical protein
MPLNTVRDRTWTLVQDRLRRATHVIQFQEEDQG